MTLHLHDSTNERLGRVLVVDDEESIRRIAVRSLTKAGFEVVEAENGERAIAALNAGDNPLMVDAILCDIQMPKINGHEAIAYFRAQYPGVPIVVLTGYGNIASAVAAVKSGAVDYLSKPADADAVEAALLQRGAALPPPPEMPMTADRVRWEHIQRVYEQCDHNVSETARRLRMHRRTLQRILSKYAPRG